jgi:hypothetical protein
MIDNWNATSRSYPAAAKKLHDLMAQKKLVETNIERLNKAKDIPPPEVLPPYEKV